MMCKGKMKTMTRISFLKKERATPLSFESAQLGSSTGRSPRAASRTSFLSGFAALQADDSSRGRVNRG